MKFFKKSKKTLFWGLFAQTWAKMNFLGKQGSVSFQIFHLFTIVQKIKKKLMTHS